MSMKTKRRGRIKLSYELLKNLLELPDGIEIDVVYGSSEDIAERQVHIALSGEPLPEWNEGDKLQHVNIVYRTSIASIEWD